MGLIPLENPKSSFIDDPCLVFFFPHQEMGQLLQVTYWRSLGIMVLVILIIILWVLPFLLLFKEIYFPFYFCYFFFMHILARQL